MVALLDGNNDKRRSACRRGSADVAPNSSDIRNIRLLQIIPDRSGTDGNAKSDKRRFHWRGTAEDWIVAVIEFFDPNDRFFVCAVSVIAGPFAERAFHLNLLGGGRHFALDGNLRRGWNRQPRHVTADN